MNSKTNIAEYKEEGWEIDWLLRFIFLMSELVIKRKHYLLTDIVFQGLE